MLLSLRYLFIYLFFFCLFVCYFDCNTAFQIILKITYKSSFPSVSTSDVTCLIKAEDHWWDVLAGTCSTDPTSIVISGPFMHLSTARYLSVNCPLKYKLAVILYTSMSLNNDRCIWLTFLHALVLNFRKCERTIKGVIVRIITRIIM